MKKVLVVSVLFSSLALGMGCGKGSKQAAPVNPSGQSGSEPQSRKCGSLEMPQADATPVGMEAMIDSAGGAYDLVSIKAYDRVTFEDGKSNIANASIVFELNERGLSEGLKETLCTDVQAADDTRLEIQVPAVFSRVDGRYKSDQILEVRYREVMRKDDLMNYDSEALPGLRFGTQWLNHESEAANRDGIQLTAQIMRLGAPGSTEFEIRWNKQTKAKSGRMASRSTQYVVKYRYRKDAPLSETTNAGHGPVVVPSNLPSSQPSAEPSAMPSAMPSALPSEPTVPTVSSNLLACSSMGIMDAGLGLRIPSSSLKESSKGGYEAQLISSSTTIRGPVESAPVGVTLVALKSGDGGCVIQVRRSDPAKLEHSKLDIKLTSAQVQVKASQQVAYPEVYLFDRDDRTGEIALDSHNPPLVNGKPPKINFAQLSCELDAQAILLCSK